MTVLFTFCLVLLGALTAASAVEEAPAGFATAPEGAFDIENAPAPLFRDPIFDGAADPSMLYDDKTGTWYMFYTQRRANVLSPGVSWCFGSKIGIARSTDKGRTWSYEGTSTGVTQGREVETLWAPHVFEHEGTYHMFVTYIPRISADWGRGAELHHYVSDDILNWTFSDRIDVGSDSIIDAAVVRLPDGRWLLVFRDDNAGVKTAMCVSDDLQSWTRLEGTTGDREHEAPVVFVWKGRYWLLTDDWQGLGVYVSDDGLHYERNTTLLQEPGKRPEDGVKGGHPGVMVVGDRAFVTYFTHPDRVEGVRQWRTTNTMTYEFKRTSLQVAELGYEDGKLTCDRDRYAKE